MVYLLQIPSNPLFGVKCNILEKLKKNISGGITCLFLLCSKTVDHSLFYGFMVKNLLFLVGTVHRNKKKTNKNIWRHRKFSNSKFWRSKRPKILSCPLWSRRYIITALHLVGLKIRAFKHSPAA